MKLFLFAFCFLFFRLCLTAQTDTATPPHIKNRIETYLANLGQGTLVPIIEGKKKIFEATGGGKEYIVIFAYENPGGKKLRMRVFQLDNKGRRTRVNYSKYVQGFSIDKARVFDITIITEGPDEQISYYEIDSDNFAIVSVYRLVRGVTLPIESKQ